MTCKKQMTAGPSNAPLPREGAAFVGLLAVLTLWQGGYYAASACVVGLVAAGCATVSLVAFTRLRAVRGVGIAIPLLIAGVGACALASSALHGLTITGIAESASWFAVAAVAFLYVLLPDAARAKTMSIVVWFGVGICALGLLLMSMPDDIEGVVNAGRLQFPFQYANTAGIFFASCALLALGSEQVRLRRAAAFPLGALLFTQSAGACGLFVCALGVLCVCWMRANALDRVVEAVVPLACMAAAFALCLAIGMNWALVASLGAFAAASAMLRKLGGSIGAKRAAFLACVLLGACVLACAGAFLQTGRAVQAGHTFVERLVQIKDATTVIASNPVFGIGPDAWRFLYPYVQSAQYTATSVHSGYVQIALDAGLVGAALFITVIVVGVRRSVSCKNVPVSCAIILIAVHGALDIDFQFSALLVFFAMLLAGCSAPFAHKQRDVETRSQASRVAVPLTFLTAAFVASAFGLWAAGAKNECLTGARAGDAGAIRRVLEENPFAGCDNAVQEYLGQALWCAGAWSELASTFGKDSISSAQQALYAAEALYALGNDAEAENVLLVELEREPGNIDLFEQARFLLASHDASKEAQKRYRSAAIRANALSSGELASLMGNQEHVPETI